jgi:hypothetical protein
MTERSYRQLTARRPAPALARPTGEMVLQTSAGTNICVSLLFTLNFSRVIHQCPVSPCSNSSSSSRSSFPLYDSGSLLPSSLCPFLFPQSRLIIGLPLLYWRRSSSLPQVQCGFNLLAARALASISLVLRTGPWALFLPSRSTFNLNFHTSLSTGAPSFSGAAPLSARRGRFGALARHRATLLPNCANVQCAHAAPKADNMGAHDPTRQ